MLLPLCCCVADVFATMADVVAIFICCVRPFDAMWQMLLPLWLMLLPFLSCFVWQMLSRVADPTQVCCDHCGRWNNHLHFITVLVLYCCTEPHPICEADDGSLQLQCIGSPPTLCIYSGIAIHTIPSKYSVVGTLYHRAKTICSQEMLLKEEQHLFQALKKCKYPTWALNRVKLRCQNPSNKSKNSNQKKQNNQTRKNLYWWFHTIRALRSCSRFGVQVHFKVQRPPNGSQG